MNITQTKIILGDEFDDELRENLRDVLMKNGAMEINKSWGLGGSQEIEMVQVQLSNNVILIESETYVGLSITGPRLVVESLAQQVRNIKR